MAIVTSDELKSLGLTSAQLAAFAGPIKLLTSNPPSEETIQKAALQIATYGTSTQPPGSENGEESQVIDPFKMQAIEAAYRTNDPTSPSSSSATVDKPIQPPYPNTHEDGVLSLDDSTTPPESTDPTKPAPPSNTNPDTVDSCVARSEGAVGSPAGGQQYQNGPTGQSSGSGEDYSVPSAGQMTDADWASMKYVTKADFERPGMMDRATVDAMDRASGYFGSKIPWTEDGNPGGHVSNSQHHTGRAFDIDMKGMDTATRQRVLDATMNAGFSGFGFYTKSPNMLHVDTRSSGNTWYWGNTNGNVPDWARPVWDAHGGTKAILGKKPFDGKPRGYVGTGEGGTDNSADLTPKETTGSTTGIGSKPIPLQRQGDQAKSAERSYVIEIVARTVYGEAGSVKQPPASRVALAAMIRNRAKSGKWGSSNMAQLCLDNQQFECWKNYPERLCNLTLGTPIFRNCVDVASQAVDGTIADPTGGATNFLAGDKNREQWNWEKLRQTAKIGDKRFYADA